MRKRELKIDVNAHIMNLNCNVQVADGVATAIIGFENRAFGTITAVKFSAIGYNAFGDVVPVNGKESFILIVQDVTVGKMERAQDLKARLPNADIRRLELTERQVCYADGKVLAYEGKKDTTFEIEELNLDDVTESEQRRALEDQIGTGFVNKPQEVEGGWLCGCGYVNIPGGNVCLACETPKETVFHVFTTEGMDEIIARSRRAAETRREEARKAEAEQIKATRKRNIVIAICVAVGILFAWMIGRSMVLAERTTYSSADEMRKALQGIFVEYSEIDGLADKYIVIEDDALTLTYIFNYIEADNHSYDYIISKWDYKNGVISTDGGRRYTVTKDGNLKEDSELYKKSSYIPSKVSSTPSYKSSYENGYSVLKFTDLSVTSNSSYTICTGKVKNTGNKTYKFIEVKGAFKDGTGTVLDTDWTYAVGSEGLAPGESSEFRLSVTKDYSIETCSVSILDYN